MKNSLNWCLFKDRFFFIKIEPFIEFVLDLSTSTRKGICFPGNLFIFLIELVFLFALLPRSCLYFLLSFFNLNCYPLFLSFLIFFVFFPLLYFCTKIFFFHSTICHIYIGCPNSRLGTWFIY